MSTVKNNLESNQLDKRFIWTSRNSEIQCTIPAALKFQLDERPVAVTMLKYVNLKPC